MHIIFMLNISIIFLYHIKKYWHIHKHLFISQTRPILILFNKASRKPNTFSQRRVGAVRVWFPGLLAFPARVCAWHFGPKILKFYLNPILNNIIIWFGSAASGTEYWVLSVLLLWIFSFKRNLEGTWNQKIS